MVNDNSAEAAKSSNTSESTVNNRFRIAHLSDLHFGRTFDAELWTYVQGVLAEHQPKLLVITGDVVDTPSLFQMGLVLQELRVVAKQLHCDFILVPGNHDVAILGNVAIWPWNNKYRIVFGKKYDRHFSRLCTFSEYRTFPLWKRMGYRTLWWLKLTFLRLTFQLKDPGEAAFRIMNTTAICGRAVFACFNSNAKLWLATGRVAHDAIQSLDREIEVLSRDGKAGWLAPRIALAHHHAIPIPYSTTTESLTSFEPFLTMRNAGTLLKELGKLEFDMLLHGHKHFWNFARMSFNSPGRRASEMAIIAAGSATMKQTNAGSNSLNLIDLMPNGLIIHRPQFFGQGMTIGGDINETQESARALLTLEQVKERAYRKAVKHLQCESVLWERVIKIDPNGSADLVLRVFGYRAFGCRLTRHARLHVNINSGGINPKSVTLDNQVDNRDQRLNLDSNGLSTRQLVVPVDLGSDVYEGREDSVNFGIQCRTMNNFAITEWEASMLPGSGTDEWAGVTVLQPTRKLRLVIEIPNTLKDAERDLVLVCQRPVNYPALSFNEDGEVTLPVNEDEWVTDQDFSNFEKSRLKMMDSNQKPSIPSLPYSYTRCEVTIDHPMVGFRYLVRWSVKTQSAEHPSGAKGAVMELRRALLSMKENNSCSPKLANTRTSLQEIFGEIFRDVLQPTFRSQFNENEGLVATVHVYNDQNKTLDLLFEASTAKILSGRYESIPLNEGLVGRVFKTRKFGLYIRPDLAGKKHDGLYVYYEANSLPKSGDEFAALAALPLYWGQYEQSSESSGDLNSAVPPEAMIGVFTLGSNASDTGLLQLATEEGKDGKGEMLLALMEKFVTGLVSKFEPNELE